MTAEGDDGASLAALRSLHAEIDREAARVAKLNEGRLRCERGCSACCLDDLTVRRVEAERIRAAHPNLLKEGEPGPLGACAFLDERGACRIYEDRPSVCRSQGLPLRVLFEEGDTIAERRDICPLNLDGGPPLERLEEHACWLVGPFELRLAAIDDAAAEAEELDVEDRVGLRTLFERRRGG